ncbi:hypothetical protein D3C77_545570 [compost metagenome]
MQLCCQLVGDHLDVGQAAPFDILQTQRKHLLVTLVAGNQAPLQITYIDRDGDTVEQRALEGQLVIERFFGFLALVDLRPQAAAPEQRSQAEQHKARRAPVHPRCNLLPGRRRWHQCAQPLHAHRT